MNQNCVLIHKLASMQQEYDASKKAFYNLHAGKL